MATVIIREGAPLREFGIPRNEPPCREEKPLIRHDPLARRFFELDDIDEAADPYENDGVDTTGEEGIIVHQREQPGTVLLSAFILNLKNSIRSSLPMFPVPKWSRRRARNTGRWTTPWWRTTATTRGR